MSLYDLFREMQELRRRRQGLWSFEFLEYQEALPARRLTLRVVRGEVVRVGCPELEMEAEGTDEVEALMRFLELFYEAKRAHILGRRRLSLFDIPHYFARVEEMGE